MPLRKHLRWLVLGLALTLGVEGSAFGASNKLKIKAPISVKVGKKYSIIVSGRATGQADEVFGFLTHAKCKATFEAEYVFTGRPSTVPLARMVHGKFKKNRRFRASAPATLYFCAYLVNSQTTKTYAHKTARWKDHV